MVLSHQYLGQLDGKLQEAFSANTSIKLAGGVSAKDARALAPMLYCQPDLIEAKPKGSFASFVRGTTSSALPRFFPFARPDWRRTPSPDEEGRLCVHNRDTTGRWYPSGRIMILIDLKAEWAINGFRGFIMKH